jgi:threonine synthase
MRYISTRGEPEFPRDFASVLLAGLAEDGGLFVPEVLPLFMAHDWQAMRGLPYPELAARIMYMFAGDCLTLSELRHMTAEAYAGFRHPAVVPLVQLDTDLWVQELFHGPTLAFKDLAMQLLGRLFEHELARTGRHVTIVGATSGDTGPAALSACADRRGIDIVMLHPEGRTSEVQRLQMTTNSASNVLNIAVAGTFDDCQALVKAMFADSRFRTEMHLSAVNSINWARVAAQVPYYVFAALALGAPDREVSFSVPTGNFGNILAAWTARCMGLPIRRLVAASNRNDILYRFLTDNDMTVRAVEPSLSPSMDIQVSSNFERLLFELLGRDAEATTATMQDFQATGRMPVPEAAWRHAVQVFSGARLDDDETLEAMRDLRERCGYAADPHTAIAIAAARAAKRDDPDGVPMVAMATAHEGKFRNAVRAATDHLPPLPAPLADLYDRVEHLTRAPADLAVLQARVRDFARRNAA